MSFIDRSDAGKKLALALQRYKGKDVVVLALPRGGVQVAVEIARYLRAPLELLLVRKIGVPSQLELAMGAVVDGLEPIVVRNEEVICLARVSEAEFDAVCRRELAELERRRGRYIGGRPVEDVSGRIVIVVDDGIATGATMLAAIRGLKRRKPSKIVVAVPVAPPEEIARLRTEADEIISLETPHAFQGISVYYEDFRQLEDEDVVQFMESVRFAGTGTRAASQR